MVQRIALFMDLASLPVGKGEFEVNDRFDGLFIINRRVEVNHAVYKPGNAPGSMWCLVVINWDATLLRMHRTRKCFLSEGENQ
jgi:hypothetical protein